MAAGVCPLTERQLTFVRRLAEGYELQRAAGMEFVTYSTARNHLQRAREVCAARTNTQLVAIVVGNGWLSGQHDRAPMVQRSLLVEAHGQISEALALLDRCIPHVHEPDLLQDLRASLGA